LLGSSQRKLPRKTTEKSPAAVHSFIGRKGLTHKRRCCRRVFIVV